MAASPFAVFLAALPADARELVGAEPDLGEVLAALWQVAQAAHPVIVPALPTFMSYLAARLPPLPGVLAFLRELPAGDLYLACGCLQGDPAALRTMEALCRREVLGVLKRLGDSSLTAEELQQRMLIRLLASSQEGEPPKLVQYAGRGNLGAWLGVVAAREALMLRRKERRRDGARWLALPTVPADPELEFLRGRYRGEFQESFAIALAHLAPRQRNLLRHQVLYRRSIDDLAALYQVNRATAARWLEKTRASLLQATRAQLMKRLGMSRDEYNSLLRMLGSHLELSLARVLTPKTEPETPECIP